MARHQLDLAERLLAERSPAITAGMAVLSADVALAGDDPDRARRLAEEVLDLPGVAPDLRCHALESSAAAGAFMTSARPRRPSRKRSPLRKARSWRCGGFGPCMSWGPSTCSITSASSGYDARRLAEQIGAVSTVATLDLQLSACYTAAGTWIGATPTPAPPSPWQNDWASTRCGRSIRLSRGERQHACRHRRDGAVHHSVTGRGPLRPEAQGILLG